MIKNKNEIESVAIGGFDGMHKAHQELFSNLGERGAILVIESGYANLTPKTFRKEYSKHMIYYYVLDSIKSLTGEAFIKLLKQEFPNLKKIVVGFDFCFGQNRKHCIDALKELFTGEVKVIDEVCIDGVAVHSRVIREYLKDGNIAFANKLLGHPYKLVGAQVKGQGLGSKEFVPTINLRVENFLLPLEGVYVTNTIVDNITFPSITFLGHRKTTDGLYAVETHILNENVKNNSLNVSVEFLEYIRGNEKFEDFEKLKKQIDNDLSFAKKYHNI